MLVTLFHNYRPTSGISSVFQLLTHAHRASLLLSVFSTVKIWWEICTHTSVPGKIAFLQWLSIWLSYDWQAYMANPLLSCQEACKSLGAPKHWRDHLEQASVAKQSSLNMSFIWDMTEVWLGGGKKYHRLVCVRANKSLHIAFSVTIPQSPLKSFGWAKELT